MNQLAGPQGRADQRVMNGFVREESCPRGQSTCVKHRVHHVSDCFLEQDSVVRRRAEDGKEARYGAAVSCNGCQPDNLEPSVMKSESD